MAKILVVDDSMMMRELIKAPLVGAGHEVLGVVPNSLSDVLNEIKAFVPNLLITDYMMPNFNGEALVRAIRATSALGDLPILVLTAHRDVELVQRMSLHGVSGYLFKGLGMQELLDRVAAILTL